MKKTYYLYVGYYMNLKVFYCTENGKLYAADTPQTNSRISLSLFSLTCVVLYVVGRKMRLNEINFSIMPYIVLSIVLGIMLGVLFSLYTDKKNKEYFLNKSPLKISGKDYWKDLLKQSRKITFLYAIFRIFLILLALIEPFLFMEVKDIILLVGYFIIWFALVWSMSQFRIRKRKKMQRILKNL